MTSYRGALIGCGFFAVNQLHAWRDVTGAEIVTICDRDPARLAHVGDQFGIAARYGEASELFEREKLDFVDIATTVPSHRALVELAARHRVPVICQKPFAASMADARAMVAACEQAGVPLMVHENFRWQAPPSTVAPSASPSGAGSPSAPASTSSAASLTWPRANASSSRTSASTASTSPVSFSVTPPGSPPAPSASIPPSAARMLRPCYSIMSVD